MTGFLSRLAARNLGQIEVVQPSLPALLSGASEGLSMSMETAPQAESGIDHLALGSVGLPALRMSPTAIEKEEAAGTSVARDTRTAPEPEKERTEKKDSQAPPKTTTDTTRETPLVVPRQESPIRAAGFRESSAHRRRQKSGAEPDIEAPRGEKPPQKRTEFRPVPVPRISIWPQSAALKSPEQHPASGLSGQTRMVRQSPQNLHASEPPVVKVHIGRIEVRAVMSQAPPTRKEQPKARPLLSLEEYLQRRDRGRT